MTIEAGTGEIYNDLSLRKNKEKNLFNYQLYFEEETKIELLKKKKHNCEKKYAFIQFNWLIFTNYYVQIHKGKAKFFMIFLYRPGFINKK